MDTPRITLNNKQEQKYLQIQPFFIYDADHDYILYEIMLCDNIEYIIQIYNYGNEELL